MSVNFTCLYFVKKWFFFGFDDSENLLFRIFSEKKNFFFPKNPVLRIFSENKIQFYGFSLKKNFFSEFTYYLKTGPI